ncbi:hypothetical protein GCM10022226_14360 [Sphaerisporangium flaviroseum]|uniref:Carrier domain-containing protein n=1 Tax=Sphaerisporangium flaviroseum TaxID=509199 RepID=A0ABP7HLN1_9ACTN
MRETSPSVIRKRVEEIWKDVLDVSPDEMDATFSELGGRGMSALRIVARIESELGIEVDPAALFDHPHLPTFVHHVITKAQNPPKPH